MKDINIWICKFIVVKRNDERYMFCDSTPAPERARVWAGSGNADSLYGAFGTCPPHLCKNLEISGAA